MNAETEETSARESKKKKAKGNTQATVPGSQ